MVYQDIKALFKLVIGYRVLDCNLSVMAIVLESCARDEIILDLLI